MASVSWDGRRRLLAGTVICAGLVAVEAIVLVASGGGAQRLTSHNASIVRTTIPFQQPRSVTTTAPAARAAAIEPAATLPAPAPAIASVPPAVAVAVKQVVQKPAVTVPNAAPATIPVAIPAVLPACRPEDVVTSATTDRPAYSQTGTVAATGVIRNVSGHDCTAPLYVDFLWCDGGSAACISAAGPIVPHPTPEIWPAGATRAVTNTWAFGQGTNPFTPHPGTGRATFTWHLSDTGAVASATVNFTVLTPPPAATTSTVPQSSTSTSTSTSTTSTTVA